VGERQPGGAVDGEPVGALPAAAAGRHLAGGRGRRGGDGRPRWGTRGGREGGNRGETKYLLRCFNIDVDQFFFKIEEIYLFLRLHFLFFYILSPPRFYC
jgi:hypothetical protein